MTDNLEIEGNLVKRTDVSAKCDYHAYREELRQDFWYSCAYCSTTEIESEAQSFEIDHYLPTSKNPELTTEYSNLMWCCERCNSLKGGFYPGKDALPGHCRFIKVDEEDPRDHLEPKGVRVEPKTDTGKFNEVYLDLNRNSLRRIRELRQRLWDSDKFIAFGVSEILHVKLDSIPMHLRIALIELKKKAKASSDNAEQVKQLIESLARSKNIDPDPETAKRFKIRRQYLNDLKAIIP